MVFYRVTSDRAELQTTRARCSEPGAGTVNWSITCGHEGAEPCGQVHSSLQKGTMGASGMLNPKGEAFWELIAFKPT